MTPDPVGAFVAGVAATIEAREMLKGGERTLLAVSGGADSLALLHVFVRLRAALRLELEIAHFDHRLRDGSAADAAFVEEQARTLGIPFHLGVAEDTETPKGTSPEEAARDRRRSFLNQVARDQTIDRIATGHTLDDQAETVLMHVLLGAGRRGVSGMAPVRWKVIRPLIDRRRAETEAFCAALDLEPRQDPTNNDRSVLRNSIRHEALPMLTARYNARLAEALVRMADLARDEDYLLDQLAAASAQPDARADGGAVELASLRAMPLATQRRMIRLLARVAGPGISAAHIERVRALADAGIDGKRLDLPGSIQARIDGDALVIGDAPVAVPPPLPMQVDVPGETELAGWGLTVRAFISPERPRTFPDGRSACVMDAEQITYPLRVRPVASGDRFQPLGMTGMKKVGDLFTDRKVSLRERGKVAVMTDADDQIVWVVGHQIADPTRLRDETSSCLYLHVEER